MSEKVVKNNALLTEGALWTYEIKSGDSKAKSVISYKDDYQGWETRCPHEGSEHPDIKNLALVKINAAREEGDLITVNLTYESANWKTDVPGRSSGEKSQERFLARPSLNDEPLFTHPKFKELSLEAQQALLTYQASERSESDYADATLVITDPLNEGVFLEAVKSGQDSWRAPQFIWSRKRIIEKIADIDLAKIGKIDAPPKDPNGDPATPADHNWLYLAPDISHSADGKSYEIEEHWHLSYKGGWDPYIYGPTSSTPPP